MVAEVFKHDRRNFVWTFCFGVFGFGDSIFYLGGGKEDSLIFRGLFKFAEDFT